MKREGKIDRERESERKREVDVRGEREKHSYILGAFCVYGLLTACDCLELHQ